MFASINNKVGLSLFVNRISDALKDHIALGFSSTNSSIVTFEKPFMGKHKHTVFILYFCFSSQQCCGVCVHVDIAIMYFIWASPIDSDYYL